MKALPTPMVQLPSSLLSSQKWRPSNVQKTYQAQQILQQNTYNILHFEPQRRLDIHLWIK